MFAVPVEASPPFHHRQDLLRARLQAVGDSGLLVEFGTKIAPDVQARVLELDEALKQRRFAGVIEAIIGYTTLLIVFDPARTDFQRLKDEVLSLAAAPGRRTRRPRRWRVPVAYGGTFGMDLEEAAARCGLSQQELTNAHAGAHYTIAMFGFLPGFAYLSGLPANLALPRRATPRTHVAGGTIAIGGSQTAIGSVPGPCGWNVIGRTPLRSFDADRYPATIFSPGDEIRFVPIDEASFHALTKRAEAGESLAEEVA